MSVLRKTWRYINEGNVHIVIGIEEEDEDSNYVLRLIKEDGKSVQLNNIHYVSSILEQVDSETNLYIDTDREKFIEKTDAVHLALISAIAKDCSIMITFTNQFDNDNEDLEYIKVDKHKVAFRLSVTDLEPKLPKTLPKEKKQREN
ncbi:uncharacterized protein isoform X2 [Choristoneura fumiferana]|uniref:uncharacterized protein isoform X2 n=1 Tax=Choristoneura fumiferana TaxID=7141 RepID=UPI003D157F14